jgi:hypothetical protein
MSSFLKTGRLLSGPGQDHEYHVANSEKGGNRHPIELFVKRVLSRWCEMIREACAFFVVASLWVSPSLGQGVIGGPQKGQGYVGGPIAQKNPVVPPGRGQTAKVDRSPSKVLKK